MLREGDRLLATGWDEGIAALVAALRRYQPDEIGIIGSPRMSNEDLWLLRRLADHLRVPHVDFRVPPATPGDKDHFLIRADKNPNTRGAELCRLTPAAGGLDAAAILKATAAKRIKLLWVFHHDLADSAWPEAEVRAALAGAAMLVFQGTNANSTSARAHLVLPSAAYVERDGTFTNFEGRVQRFRAALTPLGEARPDWEILTRLGVGLAAPDRAFAAERAEHAFAELVAGVPAFAGMSYRALGDSGLGIKG
jgi:predicted molibdopterin-dependent oxidoreductase YjgC